MTTELSTDLAIPEPTPAPVLDLNPAIQRKRQNQCTHEAVEVDDTAASLTCATCGVELDPWWYLRSLASHSETIMQQYTARIEAFAAWERAVIARLTHFENEIQKLARKRDQLWNERINGEPLGSIGVRRRRRARKATL